MSYMPLNNEGFKLVDHVLKSEANTLCLHCGIYDDTSKIVQQNLSVLTYSMIFFCNSVYDHGLLAVPVLHKM